MPEEQQTQETVAEKPKNKSGHKFTKGHPRWGGRKKRDPNAVREMADKTGADPIMYCLTLISSETVQEVQIVDGKKRKVEVPVTVDMKMEACRIVAGYLYPKLSTTKTQLTGPDEGPVTVAALDINRLLADPVLLEQAQSLALKLVEQERELAQGEMPKASTAETASVELSRNSDGYWKR